MKKTYLSELGRLVFALEQVEVADGDGDIGRLGRHPDGPRGGAQTVDVQHEVLRRGGARPDTHLQSTINIATYTMY